MKMTQSVHQNQNSAIHCASAQNVGQHKRLEYSFYKKNNLCSYNLTSSSRETAFILPIISVQKVIKYVQTKAEFT